MGKYEQMLENITAYLQLGEELQAEYDVYFQVWGENPNEDIIAFSFKDGIIASVERR